MENINDLLQKIKKTTAEAKKKNQASAALLKKIEGDFKKAAKDNEKRQIILDKTALKTVQKLDSSVLSLIKETE